MIEVGVAIKAPVNVVWKKYTNVDDVQHWAFATDEWGAKGVENDLRPGGTFSNRNFAKDGSFEFNFTGTYSEVIPNKRLAYTLDDGRTVEVDFTENGDSTSLVQRFDPESENPEEMQRGGWQAYLDNFKRFVESSLT